MPDLDLVTPGRPLRMFTVLHDARAVLLTSVSRAASIRGRGPIGCSSWMPGTTTISASVRT
jgi:hypothetical protein